MGLISSKLRNSAKGQNCTFCIPNVCLHNPETVVLCHAPSEVSGMGSKGHDFHAAFGCYACHETLDQRRIGKVDRLFYWLRGMMRTQAIWIASGLVVLPVDPATAKTRPKKKTTWPSRPIQSHGFSTTRYPMDRATSNIAILEGDEHE